MSKVVYFVRHGECEANLKGVIAGGGDDSPLTETGKTQARQTAQSIRDIDFDCVVSSPMSRTLETAQIIVNELGITTPIDVQAAFTERDVGRFTGRPKDEYFAFEASGGEVGESSDAMQQRVRRGLQWLQQQHFTRALVVTHNGTIRMIRTVLENLPAKDFATIPQLDNGGYFSVTIDDCAL